MSVEPKAILSSIFIFIGAAVFYIASLVSGRNIFRDVSKESAAFQSAIVGSILFLFSPISFMILAPDLFNLAQRGAQAWQAVHGQIRDYLLGPFVLSALGAGIAIGALEAVNARTLVLNWLRGKTQVRYPILSYELAWDRYLGSLKKSATIAVFRKDKCGPCQGKLRFYSIRGEPKEIAVENEQGYHLVEAGDIARITASSASFNRHMDKISHHAEGFYLVVAMFGMLSLAGSAALIGSYFLNGSPQAFPRLAGLYHWLSGAFLAAGFLLALVSYRASRADFRHASAYWVLCTTVPFALLSGAGALACVGLAVLVGSGWVGSALIASAAGTLLACAILLAFLYCRYKARRIDDIAGAVCKRSGKPSSLLLEACQNIYLGTDLIRAKPMPWCDMMQVETDDARRQALVGICVELKQEIQRVAGTQTFLSRRPERYLQGEELNIVLRLMRRLENERDQALLAVEPIQSTREAGEQAARSQS